MTSHAPAGSAVSFPVRLTSFVGRVAELRSIELELDRNRLVTLAGPGGSGKTRLALEVVRRRPGEHRWFVDLAGVDNDDLDAALAVSTDAPEGPGETALDATARHIGESTALLMLDNCDQVVAACARAVDVLVRACPRLSVLATSREPLRVEGEHVFRVPPLSLPADGESLDGDAVLLFLDRAGLATDVAIRDSPVIHDICRQLDGMPLAIELAAARAAVLPAGDVLAGLSDRFRLLEGGPRGADTRQQSLAASIRWSFRLLDDDERTVLQRLAVFRAPFDVDAARAVAAGRGVDERDVLTVLARLVEKSFVVIDERDRGSAYRLLETIRAYAGAQLAERPDDERATRTRHLRYLRETAERLGPMIEAGTPAGDWPAQFRAELADVKSAIRWAADTGSADDALRMVGDLRWLWYLRARADDRRITDAALAISGGAPRWRAAALVAASSAAMSTLDPAAIGFGEDSIHAAADDSAAAARAHACLGRAYNYLDAAQARQHLLRACELARAVGDRRCLADTLEALLYTEWGDLEVVRHRGEEALAIAVADGNELTACAVRMGLALLALLQGRLHDDTAAEHAAAAATLAHASGNPLLTGLVGVTQGARCYTNAELAQARTALAEGLSVTAVLFGGVFAPQVAALLADADLHADDVAAAREHAEQAVALAEQSGTDWGRSHAALAQSRVDLHDGEVDQATQSAHRALELAHRTDNVITTIDALEFLAAIAVRRRSPVTAVRLLAAAAAARTQTGYARFTLHIAANAALLRHLETALGAAEFSRVWSEAEQLPLAEAIALAQTRRGSRRRPTTGWDALTPAELRVVALVGEGLNNGQIAERLFVTRETVKSHLASAFRKLGVSSRTGLAVEAARHSG